MATEKTLAIVHTVTGVVEPVVKKLTDLLEMECCKLSSLQGDIIFMKEELDSMHALLPTLGAADDDDDDGHLDVQVRQWRDQVRKLSADIDVCVDDFTRRVIGGDPNGEHGNAVAAFFGRSAHKVATVGARHTIGNRIKKLKARINDVGERRKRYNLDGLVTYSSVPGKI